jgi:type VI protein secretion system component Hcp
MKIVLKQAVVQGMEYSEVGGEGTVERVSFAYSEIEWTYEGLDEGGKKTGSLMTAANLERK